MTKKDFELIAKIIRETEFLNPRMKKQLALTFAKSLDEINPKFNQDLFIKKCGAKE